MEVRKSHTECQRKPNTCCQLSASIWLLCRTYGKQFVTHGNQFIGTNGSLHELGAKQEQNTRSSIERSRLTAYIVADSAEG